MITPEHIKIFSPRLSPLLHAELEAGNEISETMQGWPSEGTILVFLKYPFRNTYSVEGLEFHDLVDRHYWKAEYIDPDTGHGLACNF